MSKVGSTTAALALPVLWLLAGCSSGSDDDSGDGSALLSQAPHCPVGGDEMRVEGSLDGVAISDLRPTVSNIGFVNIGDSYFASPLSQTQTAEPGQVALRIEWKSSLARGFTSQASGGWITAPTGHPRAEEKLCITRAQVGFVDGGDEAGVFKFAITGVRSGADCSGPELPVDLRGCFQ